MSQTETPSSPRGPQVSREETRDLGRLVRTSAASPENRYVGGVAGGIARHLDVDPLIIRVVLAVAVLFGGAGVLVYAAGWLLIPDEADGRSVISLDPRSRTLALWLALGLGVLAFVGDVVGGVDFPWWIIPTLVVILVVSRSRSRRDHLASDRGSTRPTPAPPYVDLSKTSEKFADEVARAQATTEAAYAAAMARVDAVTARYPGPTKRGPILFWFTAALSALAVGVLAVLDAAGAEVAPPAYPALVLAVIGLMLVGGAFWGRAGGLILAGFLAAGCLGVATVADTWDTAAHHISERPVTASAVEDRYDLQLGELEVDLRGVRDLAGLDGRTITLDGSVGLIRVLLPAGLNASAEATVDGFGSIEMLGRTQQGLNLSASAGQHAAQGPTITLEAHLSLGQIEIVSEDPR